MTTSTFRTSARRRFTLGAATLAVALGLVAPSPALAYTGKQAPSFISVTCTNLSGLYRISAVLDTNAGKPTKMSVSDDYSNLVAYRRLTRGEINTGTFQFETFTAGIYRVDAFNNTGADSEYPVVCA